MALTDTRCRAEKAGPTRRKISDGGGLQLWIQPSGAKLWQLVYYYRGKRRQMALGPYPDVSLIEARDRRTDAKRSLRAGVDPATTRPSSKAPQPGETFRDVALEYLAKRRKEGLAEVTMTKKEWLLEMAFPRLGDKLFKEIRPVDVLGVLQELADRDCYESARRLRATIGAVCRYAVITARGETDPTSALRGAIAAPKVTPRAAILEPDKFGGLLRSIDGFDGQATTAAGLQLMALLFPRPGELRHSKWPDYDFDKAIWTIPAERTKMRREHHVPLPKQAIRILDKLREETGDSRHGWLFPGIGRGERPISENTLNLALRRMGYGAEEMTSHGFRASASTMLNESGRWSSDAIERQLAHIDTNSVRRAYARGAFWDERVAMMTWWADYLDELRLSNEIAKKT